MTPKSRNPSQLRPERKPLVWSNGYAYIYQPEYHRSTLGGDLYAKRADLVLEEKLGRLLQPNEIAHHKNGVKSDDSPDNLEARDGSHHKSQHHLASVKSQPRDWDGKFRRKLDL